MLELGNLWHPHYHRTQIMSAQFFLTKKKIILLSRVSVKNNRVTSLTSNQMQFKKNSVTLDSGFGENELRRGKRFTRNQLGRTRKIRWKSTSEEII